jgi:hypothetical protein
MSASTTSSEFRRSLLGDLLVLTQRYATVAQDQEGNQWVLWIQVEPTRSRKHIAGTSGGPPEAKVSLAMGLGYRATEETKAAPAAAKRSGSSLKG